MTKVQDSTQQKIVRDLKVQVNVKNHKGFTGPVAERTKKKLNFQKGFFLSNNINKYQDSSFMQY